MIKTYDEAVEYLKSFIPYTLYNTDAYKKTKDHDPLDRMRYFLRLLKNPEKKFQSVIVGGTSGKGSTAYLISHMLTFAGYKTGLTLSPHIVRINERIQIQNREISDAAFVELINSVMPAIEKMKETVHGVPSYFEITIGMAFLHFAKESVDIAVLEVGMGGKYDATNTADPLLAVLTNVSLDHTQFLGDTVEQIAKTKVGIIKKSQISNLKSQKYPFDKLRMLSISKRKSKIKNDLVVISAVKQPSVIKIVEKKCKEVGAKLLRLGKDFSLTDIPIGLAGEYQRENASLAIEVVLQLQQFGFSVSEKKIRKALSTAYFHGRFEIITSSFWKAATLPESDSGQALHFAQDAARMTNNATLVLDGAHNQAKMHAFVTSLQKAYPKKKFIFVISFKKDKNITDMLAEIMPYAQAIVVTQFQIGTDTMISKASYEAEDLRSLILNMPVGKVGLKSDMKNVFIEKDSIKAVGKAVSLAGKNTIVAVTGSLYLVGELKQQGFLA